MKKIDLGTMIFLLIAASVILTLLGGIVDFFQTGGISKEHLWHDSMFLLVLVGVLILLGGSTA
jgi:hypothetical protein